MTILIRTDKIDQELAKRNMTSADLAREIGTTKSYLSQILRHRVNPGPTVRRRIMGFFGSSFDDLFEYRMLAKTRR